MIRCALAMRGGARTLGIEVRIGIHTGEVELIGDGVGGLSIHLGARVASAAIPGQVLVSRTVVDLVAGSGIAFVDQGEHRLKDMVNRGDYFR